MKKKGDKVVGRLRLTPSATENPITLMSVRVLTVDLMANQSKLKPSCGLINQRRPQTSYSEHRFAPSPRIRSANSKPEAVTMPRSHVSIARFYDWSEDLGECVSVSKLYRDVAGMPRINGDKVKGRAKQWCSNGIHISPGRMFLRDKAGLTKGEREIIEGIYRNRSDMQKEEAQAATVSAIPNIKDEWHFVRSHKDAWLIGKNAQKAPYKFDAAAELRLPEHMFSRTSDIVSNSPRDVPSVMNESLQFMNGHEKHDDVLVAPPTTPDKEIVNGGLPEFPTSGYRRRIYQCGEASVLPENADSRYLNSRGEPRKKKIFVNVFLPQTSSPEFVHSGLRREGGRFSRYTNDVMSSSSVFSYPESRRSQRGLTSATNTVAD